MTSSRRQVLTFLGGAAALCALGRSSLAQTPAMSRITAYAFSFAGLDGGDIRLSDYTGKPILVVNTASQCGYTPQFAGLQDLWKRFHDRGLMIIAVPSNDFGQDPGDARQINKTAHDEYGVGFPLAAKAAVRPDQSGKQHPFYKWAAAEKPLELPRWNFHKYLIGRDGHVAKVFPPEIAPTDARVLLAIGKELG